MKLRLIAALLLTLGFAASAAAQSIGLYWDPAGATCAANQASSSSGTMYILANLGGPSTGGTTGAEFRIDNFPPSWFANATPNPASNLALGGPLSGGCNIAFPGCQTGSGGLVLLYTVNYFATDMQVHRRLSVLRHSQPSNPNFQCPLQTLCDSPSFTKICVGGGQGIINGGDCTVGVEPKSWSQVKSLFD